MTIRPRGARLGSPSFQAYLLSRVAFSVAPVLFGLDKLFDYTVDRTTYLAPWVDDIAPGTAQQLMTSPCATSA